MLVCRTYLILLTIKEEIFYTFEQIRQKVKTKNFMQYNSLLSSIPKHIKKHIRENLTDCFNTFNPEDIFLERIKNNKDIKFVYISLVNNIVHIPIVGCPTKDFCEFALMELHTPV